MTTYPMQHAHFLEKELQDIELHGTVAWLCSFWILFICLWVVECRFVWDEGKYPTMSHLKDIVGSIHALVAKIEDDMKVLP
jgi:V-type H+-transporting ATPase subunit C